MTYLHHAEFRQETALLYCMIKYYLYTTVIMHVSKILFFDDFLSKNK